MLNSAADYKCVDVTGLEGFITGNPMPKRDKKGDGSWRAMKYEDLLFLQEARCERANWIYDPDFIKEDPKGRIFSKTAIKDVADLSPFFRQNGDPLSYIDHPFLDKDKWNDIPLSGVDYAPAVQSTYRNVYSFLRNKYGASVAPSRNDLPENSFSEESLNGDDIRSMFYAIKKLSRRIVSFEVGFDDYWAEAINFTNGSSRRPDVISDTIYDNSSGGFLVSSISTRNDLGSYPYCNKAYMAFCTKWKVGDAWYDVIDSVECSVSGDKGTVSSPSSADIVNALRRPMNSIAAGAERGEVTSGQLILDFGNAEIDSLNWDWQPEEGGQ